MKVLGITSEYNPFHNGHLFHLNESRRITGADAVISVMSGDFTQRGEPALLDKWSRARTAVDAGVDLVLELPFAFACNSAEYFAKGAVGILNGLGCVDTISFGSESGDLKALMETAKPLAWESDAYRERLTQELSGGASYPAARAAAADVREATLLSSPNNILGIEYLKQLLRSDSKIKPVTIKRQGSGYHDREICGSLASATSIRRAVAEKVDFAGISSCMPAESLRVLEKVNPDISKIFNTYFALLSCRILTMKEEERSSVVSAGEGLFNRLRDALWTADSIEDLAGKVKTKRYTHTRIMRLMAHTLTGLAFPEAEKLLSGELLYGRVLAFSEQGARLLRRIRNRDDGIPMLTNINRQKKELKPVWDLLRYDILASDLYHLCCGINLREQSDFIMKPYQKFVQNT